MFRSPLDSTPVESGCGLFLRVSPNMFLLHLDNNTQIRDGASHYRFLDILKNVHFTQTWVRNQVDFQSGDKMAEN